MSEDEETTDNLKEDFRKRAAKAIRKAIKKREERKNNPDDEGGRTPYGYHEGRFIGPHEQTEPKP